MKVLFAFGSPEYLRYFDTTPEEFVLSHFEHPQVRAFIGFLGVMRGYELDGANTGYLMPAMIAAGSPGQPTQE